MTGSLSTCRAAGGSQKKLKSATAVALPEACDVPPQITRAPISSAIPGSRWSTREMLVSGPSATIVTSRGWALMHSQMTFSETWPPWSGTRGRSRPPRPSAPCMLYGRAGRTASAEAAPIRGSRGGSRQATSAWRLAVACSAATLPPAAVTATTSSRGSNRAIARATASSMPGSQSMISLRGSVGSDTGAKPSVTWTLER